jgi:GT2 family glycosyltransferase
MHLEAFIFVRTHVQGREWRKVLDVGSRNVNGSPRPLVNSTEYHGIDVAPGPGVDEVADAARWVPSTQYDLALCLETFEHAREWREILRMMAAAVRPDGEVIVTTACDPREPHSGVDGVVNAVREDEWYRNIDPEDLRECAEELFCEVVVDVLPDRGDVRLVARRPRNVIDVVVLSRTPYLFERAAKSMERQGVPFRGFVVDNTPGGTIGPLANEFRWERILYPEGLTFSKGNNTAVGYGESSRILLLNDDAILQRDCVRNMLSHQEDVVGCLILGTDGIVNHAGVEWTGGGFMHMGRGNKPDLWLGEDEYTVSTTFAVALIQRQMWTRVGGLGEMYEWGFEDTDFSLKTWEAGGRVVTCRAAQAVHDEFGTRTTENDERNGQRLLGKWILTKRMFSVLPEQQAATQHEPDLQVTARSGS